jgi:hypothetical protein
VLVVEMTGYDVVDVTGMRHLFVPAGFPVRVRGCMRAAVVTGRALRRICSGCAQFVFVDMSLVRMVQMAFVDIVGMTVMLDRRVPACFTVLVIVRLMRCMWSHLALQSEHHCPPTQARCPVLSE